MNQTALTKVLIENLFDRYLPKLQLDTSRSIRKLVDLGECLSSGNKQKQFFQAAQKLLSKDDSPYYAVVQRVISQFNPRSIKTFGMNLGLNSWSDLCRRAVQKDVPPWTLLFHLKGTPDALSLDELTELLRESVSIGIHTFLLWLDRSYDALNELISRIRGFADCAFALFLPANLLNASVLQQAELSNNLLFSLEDTPDLDPEPAAHLLRKKKCPFALHTVYQTSSDAENILCGKWLERVNHLFSPFAFFLPGAECSDESRSAVREYTKKLRTAPIHPVFSMSLDDVADVDKLISGQSRVLSVRPNGSLDNSLHTNGAFVEAQTIFLPDALRQYIEPLPVIR